VRAALVILVVTLAIIADVSYQCSDRVRKGASKEDINDWEFATYLAVAVGLAGVGWVAAAAVPGDRRVSKLTQPIARYGAGAALICSVAAISVIGTFALAAGPDWGERFYWEFWWLSGAILGGIFGSAVGAGLGAAAYRSRRPSKAGATDPERDNYREWDERSASKGSGAGPSVR